MPVNYAEVMRDLEDREARLVTELNTIRSAKPAVKLLMDQQNAQAALSAPRKRFSGVGTKAALREIFASTSELLSRDQLHDALKNDGWTTGSSDPLSVISATLSQLTSAGELEKVGDRWRTPPPMTPDTVTVNLPDSAINLYRVMAEMDSNASPLPSERFLSDARA